MKIGEFRTFGRLAGWLAVAGLLCGGGMTAMAAITFSGSSSFGGTGISASATFGTDGHGDLLVTLVNTFSGDTPDQSHVLTALFFSGADGLTPVLNSAVAPVGSTEWNVGNKVTLEGGSTLGQQWQYLSGISGAPGGGTAGISSSGFGIFGSGNFATGGQALDGSAYGLLSAGYAGSTGDGLKTHGPYIQDSMTFELSGFAGSLAGISDVVFQYGTTLSTSVGGEPSITGHMGIVPEPNYAVGSTALLLLLGGLGWLRRVAGRGPLGA